MTERSAALAAGTLAAVVTALPAVPRVAAAGVSAPLGFLALAGGAALVLGPALVLAGELRPGALGPRATLFGLALAAAPLAVLADALKQGTHHRPLGAATFAAIALGLVAVSIGVAWRALRVSESGDSLAARVVRGVGITAAVASVCFTLVRALATPTLAPDVLDGLRAVATATMGHLLLRLPRVVPILRRSGLPLWVALVVAGLAAGRGAVAAAVEARAPVLGGPAAWF